MWCEDEERALRSDDDSDVDNDPFIIDGLNSVSDSDQGHQRREGSRAGGTNQTGRRVIAAKARRQALKEALLRAKAKRAERRAERRRARITGM